MRGIALKIITVVTWVVLVTVLIHGHMLQKTLRDEISDIKKESITEISRLRELYETTIDDNLKEIDRLNLTLDTTFKDYRVIQTLLNKNMEEWSINEVLAMRGKLNRLPYGSWFDGGHYVTAPWGSTLLSGTHWGSSGHKGVDIKPLTGDNYEPILSVVDGHVVTWGRNDRLFGNYLVIESSDGQFQMKLAHLSSIAIFKKDGSYDLYEGMEFSAGDRIARMGNTGNTTGPHLHIEYYMRDGDDWRLLNASAILEYIGE